MQVGVDEASRPRPPFLTWACCPIRQLTVVGGRSASAPPPAIAGACALALAGIVLVARWPAWAASAAYRPAPGGSARCGGYFFVSSHLDDAGLCGLAPLEASTRRVARDDGLVTVAPA